MSPSGVDSRLNDITSTAIGGRCDVVAFLMGLHAATPCGVAGFGDSFGEGTEEKEGTMSGTKSNNWTGI